MVGVPVPSLEYVSGCQPCTYLFICAMTLGCVSSCVIASLLFYVANKSCFESQGLQKISPAIIIKVE